jgi:hypothetical protein
MKAPQLLVRGIAAFVLGLASFLALAAKGSAYVVPQEPLMDATGSGALGLGGSWTSEGVDRASASVRIVLHRRAKGIDLEHTLTLALADLKGLTPDQANGTAEAQFRVVRDAGVLHFGGRLQAHGGSGHFTFVPNAEYLAALRALGHRTLDAEQAYLMAALDVSRAFVQDLFALGYYRLTLDDLQALRVQGVDAAYVKAMAALGHAPLTVDQLMAARFHGVTPEFIAELDRAGQTGLALNELMSFRIHDVTPAFVQEMRSVVAERLTAEKLVALRTHGVTADFVREVRALGYRSADDLVRFRIQGVTPAFIRRANETQLRPMSADRLITLRANEQRLAR